MTSELVTIRSQVYIPIKGVKKPIIFTTFNWVSKQDEHIALSTREFDAHSIPLVRLHSECLTGDIFKSQKCDCGDQLAEAISEISKNDGVILYLRQEGRGIGLYNKLDAYVLQEKGLDTYEANKSLGFGYDLRDFSIAANMLFAMGINRIRLLSNNPDKHRQLSDAGIEVVERMATKVFKNRHNIKYLSAKADITNHEIII